MSTDEPPGSGDRGIELVTLVPTGWKTGPECAVSLDWRPVPR